MSGTSNVTIGICICTSGRPFELRRCLESILRGTALPNAVLVSDDSREDSSVSAIREICDGYSFVAYQTGPRRGLCANRNAVISAMRTSHVSLLDDDAELGHGFVDLALEAVKQSPEHILTGDMLEFGTDLTKPSNPQRWGHFGAPIQPGTPIQNVCLNSNVFPITAFRDAAFDEQLVYGYEDTDLCNRLVKLGWVIEYCPQLLNRHLPPNKNDREMLAERERFVVLPRLKSGSTRIGMRGLAWLVLAVFHAAASYMKRSRWNWLIRLPLWAVRGAYLGIKGPRPTSLNLTQIAPREDYSGVFSA